MHPVTIDEAIVQSSSEKTNYRKAQLSSDVPLLPGEFPMLDALRPSGVNDNDPLQLVMDLLKTVLYGNKRY